MYRTVLSILFIINCSIFFLEKFIKLYENQILVIRTRSEFINSKQIINISTRICTEKLKTHFFLHVYIYFML